MRLTNAISTQGQFWVPSDPASKFIGTLTIKDGGDIQLDTIDNLFERKEQIHSIGGPTRFDKIIGLTKDFGYITLDNCYTANQNFSMTGITLHKIKCHTAFLGVGFRSEDDPVFDTFEFSTDCLDEWVGYTGIKCEFNHESRSGAVSYNPLGDISIYSCNDYDLALTFSYNISGLGKSYDTSVSQTCSIVIKSKEQHNIDYFISIANKITKFISFATFKPVAITSGVAKSRDIFDKLPDDKIIFKPIKLYRKFSLFNAEVPSFQMHDALFGFEQIHANINNILNNWFQQYELIEPSLNLYFSCAYDIHKYLEPIFLSLAQCLETYHRRKFNTKLMSEQDFDRLKQLIVDACPSSHKQWLQLRLQHGNEVSLRKRLQELAGPFMHLFEGSITAKQFIEKITTTRNYLTHYDGVLEERSLKGAELWNTSQNMECIFIFQLLTTLGFSTEEIKAIASNSESLKHKLKIQING